VGGVNVKKTLFGGYRVVTKSATQEAGMSLDAYLHYLIAAGVGEIFLNSVDRDGMMDGYDLALIRYVTERVDVPVVACGGAGNLEHLAQAVRECGASAVAAGSMFVFYGKHRAVLINYPQQINL
jgi:cyclase